MQGGERIAPVLAPEKRPASVPGTLAPKTPRPTGDRASPDQLGGTRVPIKVRHEQVSRFDQRASASQLARLIIQRHVFMLHQRGIPLALGIAVHQVDHLQRHPTFALNQVEQLHLIRRGSVGEDGYEKRSRQEWSGYGSQNPEGREIVNRDPSAENEHGYSAPNSQSHSVDHRTSQDGAGTETTSLGVAA